MSTATECPACHADLVTERLNGAVFGRGIDLQCDDPDARDGGKIGYGTECPDCGHRWLRPEGEALLGAIGQMVTGLIT